MGKVVDVQIDSIQQEVDIEAKNNGDICIRFLKPEKAGQTMDKPWTNHGQINKERDK